MQRLTSSLAGGNGQTVGRTAPQTPLLTPARDFGRFLSPVSRGSTRTPLAQAGRVKDCGGASMFMPVGQDDVLSILCEPEKRRRIDYHSRNLDHIKFRI